MHLKWNRRAIEDLTKIEAYIAEEKPMAAQKFVERLQNACGYLRAAQSLDGLAESQELGS